MQVEQMINPCRKCLNCEFVDKLILVVHAVYTDSKEESKTEVIEKEGQECVKCGSTAYIIFDGSKLWGQ